MPTPAVQSGRADLNRRPHGPEPCALAGLSHAPNAPALYRHHYLFGKFRAPKTERGFLDYVSHRCYNPACLGKHCGVEQWKLVGLITRRSQVRILPPLLKKPACQKAGIFVSQSVDRNRRLRRLAQIFLRNLRNPRFLRLCNDKFATKSIAVCTPLGWRSGGVDRREVPRVGSRLLIRSCGGGWCRSPSRCAAL